MLHEHSDILKIQHKNLTRTNFNTNTNVFYCKYTFFYEVMRKFLRKVLKLLCPRVDKITDRCEYENNYELFNERRF